MLYTFENCALTTVITIATLICWLVMHHNLIFMGLHFIICKFYANSLLATLNQRKGLLNYRAPDEVVSLPVFAKQTVLSMASKLKIHVEKRTHTYTDDRTMADSEASFVPSVSGKNWYIWHFPTVFFSSFFLLFFVPRMCLVFQLADADERTCWLTVQLLPGNRLLVPLSIFPLSYLLPCTTLSPLKT